MKKILSCLFVCLLLVGCSSDNRYHGVINTIDLNYEIADMSGYDGFTETSHSFRKITMHEALRLFDEGGSAIVYFGYTNCPWCIEAVPIMNEAALASELPIYYVDATDKNGQEEGDLDKIKEHTAQYLSKDSDGELKFYVPVVFVIRNGESVDAHTSTLGKHNAYERKLTEDEKQELYNIYIKMFERLLTK